MIRRRRVKRLIFTSGILFITLFAFSSCEEDSEILDIIEITKETDDDESRVEEPSINDQGGN